MTEELQHNPIDVCSSHNWVLSENLGCLEEVLLFDITMNREATLFGSSYKDNANVSVLLTHVQRDRSSTIVSRSIVRPLDPVIEQKMSRRRSLAETKKYRRPKRR